MKKTFLIPLLLAAFGLSSCNLTNLRGPLDSQPASNLYAFQAATSIGLASKLTSNQSGVMKALEMNDEDIINVMTDYLPTVDAALNGMSDLTAAQEEASDKEGYTTKLTIAFKDETLKDNSFTMYFNETLLNEEEDEEKDSQDEDEKDIQDEDEEQETKIDGIIINGENEYVMHGEKELDPEDNEYEVSFEYYIDDVTLVKVEQEIENGEQEFEYSIERDGETIYEYSIELEEDEVELEVKKAGTVENEFTFELVKKDGKDLIKAKHKLGKEVKEYYFEKVVSEDGTTISYDLVE